MARGVPVRLSKRASRFGDRCLKQNGPQLSTFQEIASSCPHILLIKVTPPQDGRGFYACGVVTHLLSYAIILEQRAYERRKSPFLYVMKLPYVRETAVCTIFPPSEAKSLSYHWH